MQLRTISDIAKQHCRQVTRVAPLTNNIKKFGQAIMLHKSRKFGWFTNCSEAILSIMTKVEMTKDIYLEMQKYCYVFGNVKNVCHCQKVFTFANEYLWPLQLLGE